MNLDILFLYTLSHTTRAKLLGAWKELWHCVAVSDSLGVVRPFSDPIGRDETNLSFFPIGVPGKRQPDPVDGKPCDELTYSVHEYDSDLKREVPKTLKIRTSSKHGFCTGYEIGILVGLITLHHLADEFRSPELKFKNERLYELMKWTKNSGQNNYRLEQGLDRLHGTELKFLNTWSVDGGKTYEKIFSTRILDSYEFVKTRDASQLGRTQIRWSDKLYQQFSGGSLKPLDTEHFYSLSRPQAQAAYRIIDAAFQARNKYECDMFDFASRIGIPVENRRRVKERLEPIIHDLGTLPGFIIDKHRCSSFVGSRGSWKLVFHRGISLVGSSRPSRTARSQPAETATKLIVEFHRLARGIEGWRPGKKELSQAEEILDQFDLATALEALKRSIKQWKKGCYEPFSFKGGMDSIKTHCHRIQRAASPPARQPTKNHTYDNDQEHKKRARRKRLRLAYSHLSKREQEAAWRFIFENCKSDSMKKLLIREQNAHRLPFAAYEPFENWLQRNLN